MRALVGLLVLLLPSFPAAAQIAEEPEGPWRRLDVEPGPDAGIVFLTEGRDLHLFGETVAYRIDPVAPSVTRREMRMPDPDLHLGEGFWSAGSAHLVAGHAEYAIDPPLTPPRPGRVLRADLDAGEYVEVDVAPALPHGGVFVPNGSGALVFGPVTWRQGGAVSRVDPAAPAWERLSVTSPAGLPGAVGAWVDGRAVLLTARSLSDGERFRSPLAHLVRFDPATLAFTTTPLPHAPEPWGGAWDGSRFWSVTPGEVYAVDPRTGEVEQFETVPPARMFRCLALHATLACLQLTHDGRGHRALRLWRYDPALDTGVRTPHPDQAGEDAPAPRRRILLREGRVWPEALVVPAGTLVTWHNGEDEERAVRADDGRFASPRIPPGGNFSFTIPRDASGAWTYHEEARGTRGFLHVIATPPPAPDAAPPPRERPVPPPDPTPPAPTPPEEPSADRVPAPGPAAGLACALVAALARRRRRLSRRATPA